MNSIKGMVSNGKLVKFNYYCENELQYTTECGFDFPVPIWDTGNAKFLNEDKAMMLMRYIRKHMDYIDAAKAADQ